MIKITKNAKGKELTYEEYEEIESSDVWKQFEQNITHQSRWNTYYETVYYNTVTEEFIILQECKGSTEYQDMSYEDAPATLYKAKPIEVKVMQYTSIEE